MFSTKAGFFKALIIGVAGFATVVSAPLQANPVTTPIAADIAISDVKTPEVSSKAAAESAPRVASSAVKAVIDLGEQRMRVYVDGEHEYTWKVSTARRGYVTPTGSFKPQWLSRMHYSRKYDNAPMPYSVFYDKGFAIHGTQSIHRLGQTASHGCVRLHTDNAKTFFSLVRKHGKPNTSISVVGMPAHKNRPYVVKRNKRGNRRIRPEYGSRDNYSVTSRERSSSSSRSTRGCLGCMAQARRAQSRSFVDL
jgi:lipoprotein-anchoring transpeptidase ErfK/SrfK